jgi:DNA-binding LacI/PurR family transcriptional regulator
MDMDVTGANISLISTDNKGASYEAVDYLIKSGRKKIAILNGKVNARVSEERFMGYKEALKANNIKVDNKLIVYTDFSVDDAQSKASCLLTEQKGIDAIFCASDLIALGTLTAASGLGIKIPEALSIIGFDDIFAARYAFGGLTTISQNYYKIGKTAAECVIDMVENKDTSKRVLISHNFILRNTTSCQGDGTSCTVYSNYQENRPPDNGKL